jgi:hypothetical protein
MSFNNKFDSDIFVMSELTKEISSIVQTTVNLELW